MTALTVLQIEQMLTEASVHELDVLIQRFRTDTRFGVAEAVTRAKRRLREYEAESQRLERMATLQDSLHAQGHAIIAGVDEVGRGCLAGPVSAAAVVLPSSARIAGIDDSKRLRPETRVALDAEIRAAALHLAVVHVEASMIDAIGIAKANTLAMRRALSELGVPVTHVLVDGLPVELGIPSTAVVGGDRLVTAIAAASIVAKVARDALMREFDADYPEYGFAANKGYGTVEHIEIISRCGPCALHRMSFSPCSQATLF